MRSEIEAGVRNLERIANYEAVVVTPSEARAIIGFIRSMEDGENLYVAKVMGEISNLRYELETNMKPARWELVKEAAELRQELSNTKDLLISVIRRMHERDDQ